MEQQRHEADNQRHSVNGEQPAVIQVVQEQLTVSKDVVETARIHIRKRVVEEEQTLNIPLLQEGYEVQHVPINKIVDKMPAVRQDGDTTIIPVVREVLVVQKQYELVEEVHVIKTRTAIPHMQDITLRKEQVEIVRKPTDPQQNP
jgi:uncharacterized protein (TIGR02271 family)